MISSCTDLGAFSFLSNLRELLVRVSLQQPAPRGRSCVLPQAQDLCQELELSDKVKLESSKYL